MVPDSLLSLAEDVVIAYRKKGLKLALAESSTGGLASAVLTTIPGVSAVYGRSYIVYSNEAKEELLEVDPETLASHGAVSPEVALEMAKGALNPSFFDISFAETGIAGPNGGTESKPVGLCYMAMVRKDGTYEIKKTQFKGDRRSVRVQIVSTLLDWMLDEINEK